MLFTHLPLQMARTAARLFLSMGPVLTMKSLYALGRVLGRMTYAYITCTTVTIEKQRKKRRISYLLEALDYSKLCEIEHYTACSECLRESEAKICRKACHELVLAASGLSSPK